MPFGSQQLCRGFNNCIWPESSSLLMLMHRVLLFSQLGMRSFIWACEWPQFFESCWQFGGEMLLWMVQKPWASIRLLSSPPFSCLQEQVVMPLAGEQDRISPDTTFNLFLWLYNSPFYAVRYFIACWRHYWEFVWANVHPVLQSLETASLWFGNNGMFDIYLQHQLLLKLPEEHTWFTKALCVVEGSLPCLFFTIDVCS